MRGAVDEARAAQEEWAVLDPTRRAERLRALARILADRVDAIVERITLETGKPEEEAVAEVIVSVDLLRFYARVAPRRVGAHRVGSGWVLSKGGWVVREPFGVVGAILPWNYPFIMVMDVLAPALAAGNALVVKPSEHTPWTAELVPDLLAEARFPEGLVQIVTGDGRTGQALIRAGVDRVVFTGSTATGRKVAAAAGDALVPVTLELGGKDPAIVLDDANLERTARGVTYGAFFNAGQTCLSVERAVVLDAVHDAFVERATRCAEALRVGEGPDADIGPMVTDEQLAIVESHVEDAVSRGATVRAGGRRADGDVRTYLPTIVTGVDASMTIANEETFGPVLPVLRVADDEAAIREANRLPYGLFASVWTGDRGRGLRVARRIRAGGVSINDALSHYGLPELPMGGVGESGFGRRRGVEGLDEMTRSRTVMVDRLGLGREPWWFPYGGSTRKLLRALLEWRGRGGVVGVVRGIGRLLD